MDDLEAARHIDQALTNLPDDYPYRDEAFQAFGRLILGRLNLKPFEGYIHHVPHEGCKWWLLKPKQEQS